MENELQNPKVEIIDNRNCVFNVNAIDERLKELGALEDINCDIVTPKQIENGTK